MMMSLAMEFCSIGRAPDTMMIEDVAIERAARQIRANAVREGN
jgi:hypothetical protein